MLHFVNTLVPRSFICFRILTERREHENEWEILYYILTMLILLWKFRPSCSLFFMTSFLKRNFLVNVFSMKLLVNVTNLMISLFLLENILSGKKKLSSIFQLPICKMFVWYLFQHFVTNLALSLLCLRKCWMQIPRLFNIISLPIHGSEDVSCEIIFEIHRGYSYKFRWMKLNVHFSWIVVFLQWFYNEYIFLHHSMTYSSISFLVASHPSG